MIKNFKQFSLITLGAASSLCAQSQNSDSYTNVIEMIELGSGDDGPLLWNMPGNIADRGENVLVGEPVPEAGALFILSTIQQNPFQDWFLDQTAVGAYLPKATMEIVTHDTTATVPRTRADQPFNIKVNVEGLYDGGLNLPPEAIQQAATEVRLQFFKQDYPVGENSIPGGAVTSDAHKEVAFEGNGDFSENSLYTSLSPSAPDKARGEEHFAIRTLNDNGLEGAAIAQAHIEVWPVWSSRQEGLEDPGFLPYSFSGEIPEAVGRLDGPLEGDESFELSENEIFYDGEPPEMTFYWEDLYPTCCVGVIVTEASQSFPWGGRWVGGTARVFNENGAVSWQHTVTDWDEIFFDQGRYAIWQVTHTPGIGWEVGGKYDSAGNLQPGAWIVPIKRDKITVRGSVHSLSE